MESATLTKRDAQLLEAFSVQLLTKLGLLKEIITSSEVIRLYGRKFYNRARMSSDIKWIKKGSKNSQTYCSVTEFMSYLWKSELEIEVGKLINKN